MLADETFDILRSFLAFTSSLLWSGLRERSLLNKGIKATKLGNLFSDSQYRLDSSCSLSRVV
jgi:hypothetical protein